MKLLNSLTHEGIEYDINSIGPGGFVSGEKFGLPGGFYGGRVDKVAHTNVPGLYMCMEGMKAIDLLVVEVEEIDEVMKGLLNPDDFTSKELQEIAAKLDKEIPSKANKNELVAIIGEIDVDDLFGVVNNE